MKETICDYWDNMEPPKTYTDWLFKYFAGVSSKEITERLQTVCADAAKEILCYLQTKKDLFEQEMPRSVYSDKCKQNNERLLYTVSKLSLALDLFAVAYSVQYKRTLDTIQEEKEKLLDILLYDLKREIETGIRKAPETANANTDAAPENHNRFGDSKSGAGGTMPNNVQNS